MNEELLAKLTVTLAGDTDLYNEVINEFQEHNTQIESVTAKLTETEKKLQETEERSQHYLGQVSNLLSKVPIGNAQQNVSGEQKLEKVKNRAWTK